MAITVRELVDAKAVSLQLEVLSGEAGMDREITVAEVSSPALVLAGFTKRFQSRRLHALGETELARSYYD